jgi:hypothetical protein
VGEIMWKKYNLMYKILGEKIEKSGIDIIGKPVE